MHTAYIALSLRCFMYFMVQINNTVQQTIYKLPYEEYILISTFVVKSVDEIFGTYHVI